VCLNHLQIFCCCRLLLLWSLSTHTMMGITSRAPKLGQQGTLTQEKRVLLQDPPPTHLISPTPPSSPPQARRPRYSPSHLYPRYKVAKDRESTNQDMAEGKACEKKPSPAPGSWLTSLVGSLNPASPFTTATTTKTKSTEDIEARSRAEHRSTAYHYPPAVPTWQQASPDARRPTRYSTGIRVVDTNGADGDRQKRERSQSPGPFGVLRNQTSEIFGRGSVPDSAIPVVLPVVPQQNQVQAWIEHPDGTKVEYNLNFMLADHVSQL